MNSEGRSKDFSPRRYRGSLMGPVVLIGLGIVFLLSNLGLVTGDAWSLLLRLWPVLLIAMGLDGILRREGLVGGALMIGLGLVLLLSNFGFLTLNIWEVVFRLWPILLIAIGFDIVIGRRSIWASLAGLVVFMAILIGALWLFGARWGSGEPVQGEQIRRELRGASRARVVLEPGAGSLRVNALKGTDVLVEGTIPNSRGGQITQEYSQEEDRAEFALRSTGVMVFSPWNTDRWSWDVGLNPETALDLDVNLGAGEAILDLSELDLSELDVSLGVGKVRLELPETGGFQGEINGAIGELEVIVPEGVGVRINADAALANVDVPNSYRQEGDLYISPNYEDADSRFDLNMGMAIGNIAIRQR